MTSNERAKIVSFFSSRTANGINNIGATCYISTALQCLGHCLSFVYPIIANKPTSPLTRSIRELYTCVWVEQKVNDPTVFIEVLEPHVGDIINLRSQNDVMEFIMLLIDVLNKDLCIKNSSSARPEPESKVNQALIGKAKLLNIMKCNWKNTHRLAHSYLCDVMYGQNVNQTKCNLCGAIEHMGDVFCNISLEIQSNSSISDMLQEYFAQENVKRNCDQCKLRNVEATKVQKLWKLPSILTIHLKRFDANNRKIKSQVHVDEIIDVNELSLLHSTQTKYELKAVACHSGSTNYGHYFALVKNPSSSWYLIDDDVVKPISNLKMVSSDTYYVMFYEMI